MRKTFVRIIAVFLFVIALLLALHEDYAFIWDHSGILSVSGSSYDFGRHPDTGSITHIYVISNAGRGQLTVFNASPSCGCTVVKLGKKTLLPGQSTALIANISLRGKGVGEIEKHITVTSNDSKNPVVVLTLEGTLWQVPSSGHPMIKEGIFVGSCASCHADKGRGKLGGVLYAADCAVCHAPGHDPTAVDLTRSPWIGDTRAFAIVSHGSRATNMPAFSKPDQGPLSTEQITSLINYLRTLHPHDKALLTPASR